MGNVCHKIVNWICQDDATIRFEFDVQSSC